MESISEVSSTGIISVIFSFLSQFVRFYCEMLFGLWHSLYLADVDSDTTSARARLPVVRCPVKGHREAGCPVSIWYSWHRDSWRCQASFRYGRCCQVSIWYGTAESGSGARASYWYGPAESGSGTRARHWYGPGESQPGARAATWDRTRTCPWCHWYGFNPVNCPNLNHALSDIYPIIVG